MQSAEPLIIYADGGSRGNPGPAGSGAVLVQNGQTIYEISKFLGTTTNNVAEYTALLLALEKAVEIGAQDVEVRMDSELIVRQMTGQYRVKHEGLKPLYIKAQNLTKNFRTFKIVHVRREMNQDADRLANMAMDSAGTT